MAILSKEELLTRLRDYIGDDTRDETFAILEDITDTLDDFQRRSDDSDWERRYNELDNSWRDKYRDRFFQTDVDIEKGGTTNDDETRDDTQITYEDLFEERR